MSLRSGNPYSGFAGIISRSPEQVLQRLDRLIHKIHKLQEPHMQGGSAADVLVVWNIFPRHIFVV